MSPEEWAFKISELIRDAEADCGYEFVYRFSAGGFFLEKETPEGYLEVRLDL